ncbi:MAG: hypothetical protein HYR66_01545 [Sphingobacteriales bacterium]|nr:hypothetical protein [Sphingobacteriales bacterium]MBI3717846.1 hypothetical protein [Sphingobacteriales bacterium]
MKKTTTSFAGDLSPPYSHFNFCNPIIRIYMKKKIIALIVLNNLLITAATGQITKKNWLVGGNASFVSNKTKYLTVGQSKMTYLRISPNIGYFLADKFAGGLKVNIISNNYVLNNNSTSSTSYAIGPFARYYFLSKEKLINLLLEGNYGYVISKPGNQNYSSFSFFAGPVIFFNSSVGLEFLTGFSTTKSSETNSNNSILINIGLQVHLERDE